MPACRFETLTAHVDWFTPDERTDRPALGAVHGHERTLLVEGGASPAHLHAFVAELEARDRPPIEAIVLTHWHWDHSFGSAALDVPVVAHEETARQLGVQASYAWSDEALDARVTEGLEIPFCADMIKLELPDRASLEIVVPSRTFADRWELDLGGGVIVEVTHVGGDHASDSSVVHVPQDGVAFLGDCHYDCLHAPERYLTIGGITRVVERLRALNATLVIEGHGDTPLDRVAQDVLFGGVEEATELVQRLGDDAHDAARDDADLNELVEALLVGERFSSP
jgi:glyoxylase-like metal-dependent hydrolase (beta-lactamase superfamily II)